MYTCSYIIYLFKINFLLLIVPNFVHIIFRTLIYIIFVYCNLVNVKKKYINSGQNNPKLLYVLFHKVITLVEY